MTARSISVWRIIHTWTSLICTLFLLMLCVTGLPLIFQKEIYRAWIDDPPPPLSAVPANTPDLALDRILQIAHHRYPDYEIAFVAGIENREPRIGVGLERHSDDDDVRLQLDTRTGTVIYDSKIEARPDSGRHFMNYMAWLHIYMMTDEWGGYLLGFMGVLFLLSLFSGVVLYGPFTKNLDFGAVRTRSSRVRWLDLHNLLGIATAAWLGVVGFTGVLHTLEDLLREHWEHSVEAKALSAKVELPEPSPDNFAPLNKVVGSVRKAISANDEIVSVLYPGHGPVGAHYFFIWTKGTSPLTSRIFAPVIVDARTGEIASAEPFPWYLRAIYMAKPIHFGDYGGLPLKIIWAALDVVAIVILGSGVYLWVKRRRWLPNDHAAIPSPAQQLPYEAGEVR